jgi:hypothetical protein
MPSLSHELLLQLLRQQPTLAADLLREALDIRLPKYTAARIESADLTDIKPTEYRADLVVMAAVPARRHTHDVGPAARAPIPIAVLQIAQ